MCGEIPMSKPQTIPPDEYRRRYIEYMVSQHVDRSSAEATFDAVGYDEITKYGDDDPEEAAADEMSNWTDDGYY